MGVLAPQPSESMSRHCFLMPQLAFVPALILAGNAIPLTAAPETSRPQQNWQPLRDEVYLQETGRKIPTSIALTSVAVHEGKVYAGSSKGLHEIIGNRMADVAAVHEVVNRLVVVNGSLWVLTGQSVLRLHGGEWEKISDQPASDLCEHLGDVIVAQANRLWRVRGPTLKPLSTNACPFPIARVISHCETLYLQGGSRLTFVEGRRIGGRDVYDSEADQGWDWGTLPSSNTRDALSLDNRLFIATDRGLGVLLGMSLTRLRGEQGLCFEDTTCLARGFTNDLWIEI